MEKGNDITTEDFFGSTNKKNNFCEQLLLTKSRAEYFRLNPAEILTKTYKKIADKKAKRETFFKETDLFLIDVNKIELLLKEEIETSPLVLEIERQIFNQEELRDYAFIDNNDDQQDDQQEI